MKRSAEVEPHPTDFIDLETLEIDQVAFQDAHIAWEESEAARGDIPRPKKVFRPRQSYRYKDPKTSQWYVDYVVDEFETFRNPEHR